MYIANWGCIPIRYICAINLLCRKSKGQHILPPTFHILVRYLLVSKGKGILERFYAIND